MRPLLCMIIEYYNMKNIQFYLTFLCLLLLSAIIISNWSIRKNIKEIKECLEDYRSELQYYKSLCKYQKDKLDGKLGEE